VFPASRPSREVVACVALGLRGHPPKGVVPRDPPRGVLCDWSRPVPGSCRGVVSPLTGGLFHSRHTPPTIHRMRHTSHRSRPPFPSFHDGFLIGLLWEIAAHNGTCATETGMPLRFHNVAFVERFVKRCAADPSRPDMPD